MIDKELLESLMEKQVALKERDDFYFEVVKGYDKEVNVAHWGSWINHVRKRRSGEPLPPPPSK